ncbi:MAG: DEAD/DEAH box helicase family protein [Aridibacter sp.]
MSISKNLVLFKYLIEQFGLYKLDNGLRTLSFVELQSETAETSLFFQNLADKVNFDDIKLKEYDENIIRHLETINRHRNPKFNLKYYQYFSLLFTEYYLDHYLEDDLEFAESLQAFATRIYADEANADEDLKTFDKDELNLIAYWMATGSGKTLILHFNVLQYKHYAKKHSRKTNNFILLTPNASLSEQHLADARESGIEADFYKHDKSGDNLKIIDIHKIREFASGQGVTVSVDEFGQENVVFVDEGHKGDKKDESVTRALREKMGFNGFTFEYSATFGQVGKDLQNYYAKRIIFDYSYKYFYKDGYGKDYYIDNISDNKELDTKEGRNRYLMLNLLVFGQQKALYNQSKEELSEYQLENPLQIFVGHTVIPKATAKGDKENNEQTISDVKLLLEFYQDFLKHPATYKKIIQDVIDCKDKLCEEYNLRLKWLFTNSINPNEIYNLLLNEVFNADTPTELELHTIQKTSGEIALNVKGNKSYFGLINIGDVSAFKTQLKEEFSFERDVFNEKFFENLSATVAKPINILIGARKFIEGWNNYRVSGIGLINFGKSEGSQIIQLFGRGVRLRGRDNSLKRSTESEREFTNLPIVETLNVFGLNADYITKFKDSLEAEGVKTEFEYIDVPTYLYKPQEGEKISDLGLITIKQREDVQPFYSTDTLNFKFDANINVNLDLSTKKHTVRANINLAQTLGNETLNSLGIYEKYIDFNQIYLELLELKRLKKFDNLNISKNNLKELCRESFCKITLDTKPEIESLTDIENLQKITVSVLKKYLVSYYSNFQRVYEAKNMQSVTLTEEHPALQGLDYSLKIEKTDGNGVRHPNINVLIKEIEEFVEEIEENIEQYKDLGAKLKNVWFDQHLFQPLLISSKEQETRFHIEAISPQGINEGEADFVSDFSSYIASSKAEEKYSDCDFYLLRNGTRSKGFGFYFSSAGGFFPDFLLWIKQSNESEEKQYLTFVDPHGLRNEQGGSNSDKIKLAERLKDQEKEFPDVKE